MDLLLQKGANVNAATKAGFTPLVFATLKNDDLKFKIPILFHSPKKPGLFNASVRLGQPRAAPPPVAREWPKITRTLTPRFMDTCVRETKIGCTTFYDFWQLLLTNTASH